MKTALLNDMESSLNFFNFMLSTDINIQSTMSFCLQITRMIS